MKVRKILTILFLTEFALSGVLGEELSFRVEQLKADPFTHIRNGNIAISIPEEKESRNETRGGAWIIGKELLERLKGHSLSFRSEVRWKDLAPQKENSPAGGKILAIAEIHDGMGRRIEYQVSPLCNGTSPQWRKYSAEFFIRPTTESLTILFGIQKSSGSMEFRNVRAETSGKPVFETIWTPPENFRCEYSERVMRMPQMRGFMSPPIATITHDDLRDMAAMGANLLRWQMNAHAPGLEDWKSSILLQLNKLEQFLPLCRELGISVISDLHPPPGNRKNSGGALGTADGADKFSDGAKFVMFDSDPHYQAYLEIWSLIARRFKNQSLYGYDLCNEPAQMSFSKRDYLRCYYECAKRIRSIDPETPILIESNEWAAPEAFSYLKPLPFRNIIYQAHMYRPGSYTHQGVGDFNDYSTRYPASRIPYPGILFGKHFDKVFLRNALIPVRQFQQKYHARILIGEFGVVRWAENGECWLDDVLSIFEEFGWDWCYHAFREWHGWSLEHSSDPKNTRPVSVTTPRKKIILNYLKKNQQRILRSGNSPKNPGSDKKKTTRKGNCL